MKTNRELVAVSKLTFRLLQEIGRVGSDVYISGPEDSQFEKVLRSLLHHCVENRCFMDELMIQMTRFISDFGEPDCKEAIMYWKIMTVLVVGLSVNTVEVADHLLKHFKCYSMVDEKLPREKMRLFEARHANYCLKAWEKSLAAEPRKTMPSKLEIKTILV